MGKNKNKKNKSKSVAAAGESSHAKKELSEADAAAGALVVTEKPRKNKDQDNDDKKDQDPSTKVSTKPNVNSKRARDIVTNEDDNKETKLTRKQKRQKLNEKNKWPQHPKISDPEARSRAYLRVAGIEAVKDNADEEDEEAVAAEPMVADSSNSNDNDNDDEWRRFGRFLGAADARTRHKAVKRLGQYLKIKSGFGVEDASDVVGLSELDLLKLWKGLWFTLYMADKVPVQDELSKQIAKLIWCLAGPPEEDDMAGQAYLDMEMEEQMAMEEQQEEQHKLEHEQEEQMELERLKQELAEGADSDEEEDSGEEAESDEDEEAEMMHEHEHDEDCEHDHDEDEDSDDDDDQNFKHIRGASLAQLMVRTFFRTLVREWDKMDKYRVDKFYTLVRYMLAEIYKYMAKRQWNLGIIKLFNDALAEEALRERPNGVRYHLIDIAVEEFSKVVHSRKNKVAVLPVTEAIFIEVMEPFFAMAQHGFGDKTVQERVVEKVLEKFLMEYSVVSQTAMEDAGKSSNKILDQVHVGTVSTFLFEMASDESTMDGCRKSLYDMHKLYERQRKKAGTDLELRFEKEMDDDEDEDDEVVDDDDDDEVVGVDEDDEADDADYSGEEDLDEDDDLKYLGFMDEDEDDDEEEEEEESPKEKAEEGKKNKKKKKPKKEKKRPEKDQMDITHHDAGNTSKKAKKGEKNKHGNSEGDEVLTISMSEQKNAKRALKEQDSPAAGEDGEEDVNRGKGKEKKSKKRAKSEGGKKDKTKEAKRRVSFGNQNQARSWKASMKGLRTFDPSEVLSKSPDKSILLNKGKKSPVNKNANRRKRAVDYF